MNFRNKKRVQNFLQVKKKNYLTHIESTVANQLKSQTKLRLLNISEAFKSASILAFIIAKKLERRVKFPNIKREILFKIKNTPWLQGIRISCSGSMKGGLMARTYTVKFGQTPLHVFSKKVDYAFAQAKTRFGILGIKVWISFL